MEAFLASFFIVVLAEMGDKTQLLVMAFATRYPWKTVMGAVSVTALFNNFIASVAGVYLTKIIPIQYVQIAASASFILFGLLTLKSEEAHDEAQTSRYGPFLTVAVSFFLAELGDKTQLAALALAAKYNTILPVCIGTTGGMMIADGLGIVAGVALGKKVPEKLMKWIAATIFILFGILGLYENLPHYFWTPSCIIGGFAGLIVLIVFFSGGFSGKQPSK